MTPSVGFLGFGCALPDHVRTKDDPIFNRLRAAALGAGVAERELFEEVAERRYLAPEDSLEDLTARACQRALGDARLAPGAIDRLYGYVSVSEYLTPNGLFRVHRGVGLSSEAMVLPIDDNFTTFITSAVLGYEAITAGHCEHALIACGSSWTRHVDYDSPHAVIAGDGAGAAVLGPSERNVLIDFAASTFTDEDFYHGMTLKIRSKEGPSVNREGLPVPTFAINEGGVRLFMNHGLNAPPALVKALLERHRIRSDQVCLIAHQGARRLTQHWAHAIQPRQHLDTVDRLGDLGGAAIPVTLASRNLEIEADYIVLVAPGPGAHFAALLLKR